MDKITRSALRYFGGKWRLAPWILSWFPFHTTYVEPFCGAASVFLRKNPVKFEVINDLDSEVINFFRVLRERSDDLIRAIELTPYSREEYKLAWISTENKLEKARRYYIRSWQSWIGTRANYATWRIQHSNNRGKSVIDDWTDITALWPIAKRLRQAFIEQDDAMEVIKRFDQSHTLFYLDPPYLSNIRNNPRQHGYTNEIDDAYHVKLLALLQQIRGMAIISGYPSRLYDQELSTWHKAKTKTRTTNTSNTVTETLWISPSAMEARQRTLF